MLRHTWLPRIAANGLLWLIVPLFAACGGGGGGGDAGGPIQPPLPVTEVGVFIDSPVEGLGYQSGSNAASTTNAEGLFVYEVGETLSFSIGGVQLGTLPDGQPVVTPYDFGAAAENIARLLQTLDADGNHLNGIDLSAAATALAGVTFAASGFVADSVTFETAIQPVLDAALGSGATLIDAATAMANLDAALDTTFDVAELADRVLVIDLPSEAEVGFLVFDPLTNEGDSGSSVELILLSDTLAAGGDGTTTELDWSVDENGLLTLSDPLDAGFTIAVERLGGSSGVISISLTDGVDEIVGSFLIPATGVEADLSGDTSRSFDMATTTGTERVTFFSNGIVSRVAGTVTTDAQWSLESGGSLISTIDANNGVTLSVLLEGGFASGGETITFNATNLSGDPDAPIYELVEMFPGSIVPVSFPDPSTAVAYTFVTGNAPTSQDAVLEGLFAGISVSGSFRYANWVPPLGVLQTQANPGAVLYPGAILDLAGSVNGQSFSGAIGYAVVGNERYVNAGGVDFMQVGDATLDSNFEIGDYRLIGVRHFWIESVTTPGDFLDSDLLPATPPVGLTGRFALDFELISNPQTIARLFFDDSVINPAP